MEHAHGLPGWSVSRRPVLYSSNAAEERPTDTAPTDMLLSISGLQLKSPQRINGDTFDFAISPESGFLDWPSVP